MRLFSAIFLAALGFVHLVWIIKVVFFPEPYWTKRDRFVEGLVGLTGTSLLLIALWVATV